ncbi:DUF3006 domain-containing protein [Methanomethylovorans sp.]|uniref:DUF3006 domain-containing protein n=1 Tax=Methanomethylovorans sp. TaxID=2758717 RepID=UPI00351C2ABD
MSFKATLDRIENKIAVLLVRPEESTKISMPLSLLPESTKEGDILDIDITKDVQETKQAKARVSARIDKLKNKN